MLTVEKLKAMKPWEIFAKWEAIDDWKVFNIWGEWHKLQRVAVRGKGYHDRAIYFHIINPEATGKAVADDDFISYLYNSEWGEEHIASNGDKLTRENTIKSIVPCDEESFNLYRY